jgi:hypothetical protein
MLGVLALRTTKATRVIAIGGGMVLRREYDLMRTSARLTYKVIDAVCVQQDREFGCAIIGLDGVEVVAHSGAWAPSRRQSVTRRRPVMISMTVMNLVGIQESQQTYKVDLYLRMQWETRDTDKEDWEPSLEWRNADSVDESNVQMSVLDGYKYTCSRIKACLIQPLDLRAFPFE